MAVIKCKMCGGDLVIEPGATVAECEYCGTRQTIPNQDDEKKLTLFARANRLRMGCEFDKAAGIYESIVADFPQEAEAYWGLVLCKYGIEYVDDPATGKKIPTCHRSSFDSILEDSDFEQAQENADVVARKVYREEAKQIEDIRKGIIEVSGKEEPYDIFICYKETDENGQRTVDSVIAQDVYDALTEKGYRVFFSRITLEDKLGQEYEPYIFAALNSAKIMLAFGTDYEYYNAVWVKNEWSRYLKLMAKDKTKHLIPCYKGIDAYDMPKEFAKLQAQDMGKVGAMQDLMRGIEKLLPRTDPSAPVQQVVQQVVPPAYNRQNVQLDRGFMALEDSDWEKADGFFEEALNLDARCADAYLGKLMAELRVTKRSGLANCDYLFDSSKNYQKAIRFGSEELKNELNGYIVAIQDRKHQEELRREQEELRRKQEELRRKQIYQEHQKKLELMRARIPLFQNCIYISDRHTVGLQVDGTVVAVGENKKGWRNVSRWRDIVAVSTESNYIVGLKSDGTVVAAGENENGQCNVSYWRGIVAVSAGSNHTVGLRLDGTVVAEGWNRCGQCNVFDWQDIVAVSAGSDHTVGLKSDGTVVAVGDNMHGQCNVSGWRGIEEVSTEMWHTVGLKSDGTVVAVGYNEYGQCNVSDWQDIVAVSVAFRHTVGLKSDGTVVAVGYNEDGQCNVSDWRDIVAVSAGSGCTVGLKSDGTVVAVGYNEDGRCNVSNWRDIVAVKSSGNTVGLKSDGTVVAVGYNKDGQCNVSGWRLFQSADRIEKERIEAKKMALEQELSSLKGLFTGRRRRQIEEQIRQIDYERD